MPNPGWRLLVPLLAGGILVGSAAAQELSPDDPVPAGAIGKVLQLSGKVLPLSAKVLPIEGKILEIKGIGSGLAATVTPVKAALEELGAKVEDKEIKIDLAADVLFDFDKADLRAEAAPSLARVAEVLAAYPAAAVLIEGHTDAKGSDSYNQKLSERRAKSVVTWLAGKGVTNTLTAKGLGEKDPVASNTRPDGSDDPQGRQKNRRVAITVRTE